VVELDSTKSSATYGMIAYVGDDQAPYPPSSLMIYALKGNYIILMKKEIQQNIEIKGCKQAWNEEKPDQTWKNYCECYQKNLRKQSFFQSIIKEMNEMVKSIR
jgi:uncharacterized membrane protein